MSHVVSQLNLWFGIRHISKLGSNKQILRHLKALVHDQWMVNRWSDPIVLPLIVLPLFVFSINDSIYPETGVRPLDAEFGSEDGPNLQLPESAIPK